MKSPLTKTLFILLLLSAVIPSGAQSIELRNHYIKTIATGTVIGAIIGALFKALVETAKRGKISIVPVIKVFVSGGVIGAVLSVIHVIASKNKVDSLKSNDSTNTESTDPKNNLYLEVISNNLETGKLLHKNLCCGIISNSLEQVRSAIKSNADINLHYSNSEIPLVKAAGLNNLKIVKLLLNSRADINARDSFGDTPLHKSCFYENSEKVATLLIQRNANVNAINNSGYSPLDMAENRDITHLLQLNGAQQGGEDKELVREED